MQLHILSDLHIKQTDDPLYSHFVHFLNTVPQKGDYLVLNGDIFDFFVSENPFCLEYYQQIIQSMTELAKKTTIYYLEGNHDFLLKKAFPGIQIASQELFLTIGDKKFYFSHGDLANPKDYGYLFFRKALRSLPMKLLIQSLSGSALLKLADFFLNQSKRKNRPMNAQTRKIYRSFAAQKIKEGADFVVLGHTHDLDEMDFTIDERTGQYINIGYPRQHKSYLSWELGDKKITRKAFFQN
jgi:UDP-2,3-diacylglucosamine hydrolase